MHKIVLYSVLTFVFIGGALTLAGPDKSDGNTAAQNETTANARELVATKFKETSQVAVKATEAKPGI